MLYDDYNAWDECPEADDCELIRSFLELVDAMVLWSSFFVTLVAKKYRLATMLPFVPRMVCDSR